MIFLKDSGELLQPAFLETKTLASINLWMNSAQARSSTHYDPHHNLLCIIAGCKQGLLFVSKEASFPTYLPLICSWLCKGSFNIYLRMM